jgi:hypothetical protein
MRPFDKIEISFIPHDKQRYPTVGDWRLVHGLGDEKILSITVSELSDWRYEALVAVHELVEVLQCQNDGVSQEAVDQFDMEYEKNRPEGDESEPGDDPKAPYKKQHFFATNVEALLSDKLGVDWKPYEKEVQSLP